MTSLILCTINAKNTTPLKLLYKIVKEFFMYYFPNLDDITLLIMITELERDFKNGLFYIPKSIKPDFVCTYKRILKASFEKGDVNSLRRDLIPNFFKTRDINGKKIPSNIRDMVAFSEFNRYYARAILVRAIDENKSVTIYRARKSVNERAESKQSIHKNYFTKGSLEHMLAVLRDYNVLFSGKVDIGFMQPNSGLSLKLG